MNRFKNILFVTDPSEVDAPSLAEALKLAELNNAKMTILGVIEASSKDITSTDSKTQWLLDAITQQARLELQQLIEDHQSTVQTEVNIRLGKSYLEVIRQVLQYQHDLVIKGAENLGGLVQKLTSTDMKLLRKCPCPVWIDKRFEITEPREVLVALDYDPENAELNSLNKRLLELAGSLALLDFSELHVVHAWELDYEPFMRSTRSGISTQEVDEMLEREKNQREVWFGQIVDDYWRSLGTQTEGHLQPRIHLIKGRPDRVVPELTHELGVELLVMGSVGRTGIPGFVIGNTAENILQQIACSVLTVKPAGFVTPVTLE